MDYNFDKSQFDDLFEKNNGTILYKKVSTDLITPVQASIKLFKEFPQHHLLFESAQNNQMGKNAKSRFCVIGVDPDQVWKCTDKKSFVNRNFQNNPESFTKEENINPLENFRKFFKNSHMNFNDLYYQGGQLPAVACGVFGYFNYDVVKLIEDISDSDVVDDINIPDSIFIRPQILVIFDNFFDIALICAPKFHDNRNSYEDLQAKIENIEKILGQSIANSAPNAKAKEYKKFESNYTKKEYCEVVEKCKEYIVNGDVFQILPSQRFTGEFGEDLNEFEFYRTLRSLNPSPFLFYMKMGDFVLTGSSPEIMVSLKDKIVTIRPLAGTRKRGKTLEEDKSLAKDLLSDEKELAEHLMLIDLGRHDIGKVSKPGTVETTEKMKVEYYSHVMHISSNVQGVIRDDLDALDALKTGFPAGTVSGAPKIRAMEILQDLEKTKRSFYAGCVGYFSGNGDMETCITLRSALIKDGKIYLHAGAGVVYDSIPELEYQECLNKAQALMKAYQEMKTA